jgi:soluble lytic murein transglycosylase-like protein
MFDKLVLEVSGMTYYTIIVNAAKAAKVSAILLYSICAHESNGFTLDFALYDNGSPSFSVCQIKKDTAIMLGWHGKDAMELRNPTVGAKYAALYLKYQLDRYNGDTCKAIAAYNAGSYLESIKKPGYPKNLKYVRLVSKRIPKEYRKELVCGTNR